MPRIMKGGPSRGVCGKEHASVFAPIEHCRTEIYLREFQACQVQVPNTQSCSFGTLCRKASRCELQESGFSEIIPACNNGKRTTRDFFYCRKDARPSTYGVL